jgi:uncharacterized protein YgbK (DUF1537 family)
VKTIVLDDDPTGTQSASNVDVLLNPDAASFPDELRRVLGESDAVYVQTNSRALDEAAAVALVESVRREGTAAAAALGTPVRFVLRGDSTLRGHVFAESEVFAQGSQPVLFVPAFPAGGRTTVDGVHWVLVRGQRLRADETEFAADPVFPFRSAAVTDYVADATERSNTPRHAIPVTLTELRTGALTNSIRFADPSAVIVPDVETDDDVHLVAEAVRAAERSGAVFTIRSAAPLAAELAGVASKELLPSPVTDAPMPTLVAVGSHTAATTAQVAALNAHVFEIDTEAALANPLQAGRLVAEAARGELDTRGVVVVATARQRQPTHNTLDHGERVMSALTSAVRDLLPHVGVVVAKGGITSAEVARTGVGAARARVLGQILPGISLWDIDAASGRPMLYVVVPGNVGDDDTLTRVLQAVRVTVPSPQTF